MKLRLRRSLAVATAFVLMAVLPTVGHSATSPSSVGPKAYYLALGDSLAFGYQPNLNLFQGYATDFFHHFRTSGQRLIDMACVDESTTTFINGGCPFTKFLRYKYTGPQLAAAISFIQQHPGQVSPVTIDIAGNDILPLMNPATCSISTTETITQLVSAFDTNFNSILSQLKTALHGSGDLFTMNYYMPYQNQCPNLLPYLDLFNTHIAAVAQANGVPVADVFSAFGGPSTPNPNLCNEVWTCAKGDVHPTTRGYSLIAQTFETLAGYKQQHHRLWHWWR